MKTALGHNNASFGKSASFFRALAPVVTQDQDDRMRQIIREELSRSSTASQPQQPSLKVKKAYLDAPLSLALIDGFSDELQRIKLANLSMGTLSSKPTVSSDITAKIPRTKMRATTPNYSQVNPAAATPGSAQTYQPTLSPPPVRG